MIFEIFNAVDGSTHGYRFTEARAVETCKRLDGVYRMPAGALAVFDYLPAKSGFYILDMRDTVKGNPFADLYEAERAASFENMCSDYNAYRVFHHTYQQGDSE